MARFVVRRLLLLVPILLGLSILLFVWVRALPGSTAQALLGERATPAAIARFNSQYGLDRPITTQYWSYLKTTVRGDLGTSVASRRPVTTEIRERFPATVELAFAAMAFALVIGLPLGFFAAKQLRAGVRPLEPLLIPDRGLDPGLLPRDHPQVRLLGTPRAGCRASGARTC